jgi:hypothetical protein
MKLLKRFILVLVAISVLCAIWYSGACFGRAQIASQHVGFNAGLTVAMLESIRRSASTTNIISLLEAELDSNVYAISVWRKQAGSRGWRDQMSRGLMKAARYRERYPRKPLEAYRPPVYNVDSPPQMLEEGQRFVRDYNATIDALLQEGRQLLLEKESKPQKPTMFMSKFVYCKQIIGDNDEFFELTDWQGKVHTFRVGDVVQDLTVKGARVTEKLLSKTCKLLEFTKPGYSCPIQIDEVIDTRN